MIKIPPMLHKTAQMAISSMALFFAFGLFLMGSLPLQTKIAGRNRPAGLDPMQILLDGFKRLVADHVLDATGVLGCRFLIHTQSHQQSG